MKGASVPEWGKRFQEGGSRGTNGRVGIRGHGAIDRKQKRNGKEEEKE